MTGGRATTIRRQWWAWAIAALVIAVAVAPLVQQWLTNPDDQRLVDLDVYRTGGQMILDGRSVYEFATPAPQLLPFTYPPIAAMLAVLLAKMSWDTAQWVWTAGVFVSLAVVVAYSFRGVLGARLPEEVGEEYASEAKGSETEREGRASGTEGEGRASGSEGETGSAAEGPLKGAGGKAPVKDSGGKALGLGAGGTALGLGAAGGGSGQGTSGGGLGRYAPWIFAFLVVACAYLMPIRDQVRFGQVDILLVALCLVDCVARRPWWPRGFLIGLATAVKLTPGVFLIYLLVTRQWRTFFMAAFAAALLTLLPFAVIPHDAVDFWFSALLDPNRLGANAATTNQSIRGMLIRLYLNDTVTSVIWIGLVAVVGWFGFRGARDAYRAKDPMTAVALVGLMAALLSPVGWIHHFAWVVVVLGAIVGDGRDPVRVRVAVAVWLYYVLPIPWWGVALKVAGVPVLDKIVQDGFGLGALGLVWLLVAWLPKRRALA